MPCHSKKIVTQGSRAPVVADRLGTSSTALATALVTSATPFLTFVADLFAFSTAPFTVVTAFDDSV